MIGIKEYDSPNKNIIQKLMAFLYKWHFKKITLQQHKNYQVPENKNKRYERLP